MKSSIILVSACASLALATPAIKRDIATEVVLKYVTVTVTGKGPSPTAPPAVQATPGSSSGAGAFFAADSNKAAPSSQAAQGLSAPIPSVDTSSLSDYAAPIIKAHNDARAQHGVAGLVWDDSLAAIAQSIGQTCVYKHNTEMGGGGYGQNIAAGAGPGDINNVIYQAMYQNEIVKYNAYGGEPDINSLGDWGHATQIIWKGTQKVGCATVSCNSLQNAPNMAPEFTVCNYSPAGNMIGSFAENVLP